MAAAAGVLDEVVKEYLLYRGFTNTLKAFEVEKKEDKDKGYKVNRIVDYILSCITRSDFVSLQTFWVYLNKRFFSRLSQDSALTVYRLETSILRLFLVQATRQNRQDVVKDFFEKMADALHDKKEWKDWFALPFSKNPDQHPSFKLYFSKEWADAFYVTLHNFFSSLFSCLPLPTLLNFEEEHRKMQVLSTENHHLQNHLATTRQQLADAESTIQKLESKMSQQEAKYAQQLASQTATQTVSKKGLFSKTPGKTPSKSSGGSKRVQSPKKPVGKAMSLDRDKIPEGNTEALEKQISEPVKKSTSDMEVRKNQMSLTKELTDSKESDLDIFSPASVVGVSDEGCVQPYPVSNGNTPFFPLKHETYRGHSAPITHCKFSPNASSIATGDTDGVVRIWDPSSLQTSATLEVKPSLLSLDWAPQSDNLLLVGSSGGAVRLFDCTKHRFHWTVTSEPDYQKILCIVSGGSSSIFACSAASSSGTPPNSSYFSRSFGLTSPSLPSSRFVSGEMNQLHASVSNTGSSLQPREVYPGAVYIYDIKTQLKKCSLPLVPNPVAINCMAFNHNCNLLVTGASDGMIRLFDVAQQEYLFGWRAHDYSDVFNVQFSSDETSVYSMGCDNRFCQWSINRSGDMVTEFGIHKGACRPTDRVLKGEYYPNTPKGNLFAFESEDRFVLTCAPDQAIVYQVEEGGGLTKTLSITGHSGAVTCVDWLHNRRSVSTCVTGSLDTTVKITNLLNNE